MLQLGSQLRFGQSAVVVVRLNTARAVTED